MSEEQCDKSVNVDDAKEPLYSRRALGGAAVGAGLASVLLGTNACASETASTATAAATATTKASSVPEGFEGNIAVCTVLTIKKELESAADSVWDRHKKWLKATHGPWGMFTYTVAKNVEFKNPLNPGSKETTGRIIYVIHEVYQDISGLNKHYSESPNGGYVEDFLKICTAEGSSVTVLQGAKVTHSLLPKDCDFPVVINKSEGVEEKYFKK